MEVEEVVKCGSLCVPPQGFLKQKKSWHKKYYVLYRSSRQGIQRLEVFDNEEQYLKQNNCHRIIALTDCLKVAPLPQKQQSNVFEIRTKENTHLFSSDTFHEMTEWLNCLQTVAFGNHNLNSVTPFVATKNFSLDSNANQFNNNSNSLNANNLSDAQSEENLLYSSVDAPDVYRVKLIDSETSIRCGLRSSFDSNYTLIVTAVNISLAEEGKVLFSWPYRHIRRYGCTKDGFSLEAGRKCASGDGLFSFITKDGNSIFQAVATHVNSLKESRNLNEDTIAGFNISPKLTPKEIFFSQNLLNDKKPSLPSTSPPVSSNYLSKSNYFATNSSLLPSTKIPESSKRHSIQPQKSPQMIAKQPLTRVTSVTNTNPIIATNDPKPKPSPPISKPPRKSKESKNSESEEPVFASREEVLNMNCVTNNSDILETYKPINDEILYDEPGDPVNNSSPTEEQHNKTPFCPSPPPVNQTVSKLTSVLKMMFSGSAQNQIHPKYKESKRNVSTRSSTGSSGNASTVSSPIISSAPERLDSEELAYAEVSVVDINKSDKNKIKSDVNSSNDSNNYSKILNDSSDSLGSNYFEHQYANVIHQDINDSKITVNSNHNNSQTEHYVQNDCEYARVVKYKINNTSV